MLSEMKKWFKVNLNEAVTKLNSATFQLLIGEQTTDSVADGMYMYKCNVYFK